MMLNNPGLYVGLIEAAGQRQTVRTAAFLAIHG